MNIVDDLNGFENAINGKGSWALTTNLTETEFAPSGGKIRNPDA